MALGQKTIFTQCPECTGTDIREAARFEAGDIPGSDEDFAVYECRHHTCGLVFDYITHPKEN